MPYDETRAAIDRTRAVLITVGIVTMSLSMIALWLVVRYVVVKPLTHLRDVSDAVSTGDLAQRADIHTGDEFEDLASVVQQDAAAPDRGPGRAARANLKLDGKVDELARLNMQLHEMNRLKGEFLASMSHELRTPLNSIIGFSEVLQGIDALNDKQKRYVQNIQKSGRHLLEMINDILDLAKMEAGKMEVRLSEFRIDSVIHAQCDLVRTLAEDKNIDLTIDIASDLPLLYQDQTKVQQILTNLLLQRDQVHARRGPDHRRRPGRFAGADRILGSRHRRGHSRVGTGNHLREVPPGQSGARPRQPDARIQRHGPGAVDRQGVVQAARRRSHRRKRAGQGLDVPRGHPLDAGRPAGSQHQAQRQARRADPPAEDGRGGGGGGGEVGENNPRGGAGCKGANGGDTIA